MFFSKKIHLDNDSKKSCNFRQRALLKDIISPYRDIIKSRIHIFS